MDVTGPTATVGHVSGELDPRELRVSDAEREHVGELLQRAVGQGMLTVTEFDERMTAAMAARTRGELNMVLVDLPGARVEGRPARAGEPVVLRNSMSNLQRRGSWTVPDRLVLRSRFGNTILDLSEADLPGPAVDLELNDVGSNITIVLPLGGTVDAGELQVSMGSLQNAITTGGRGKLHLTLHGKVRMGSVTVRTARSGLGRRFLGA